MHLEPESRETNPCQFMPLFWIGCTELMCLRQVHRASREAFSCQGSPLPWRKVWQQECDEIHLIHHCTSNVKRFHLSTGCQISRSGWMFHPYKLPSVRYHWPGKWISYLAIFPLTPPIYRRCIGASGQMAQNLLANVFQRYATHWLAYKNIVVNCGGSWQVSEIARVSFRLISIRSSQNSIPDVLWGTPCKPFPSDWL
jgi:hypothetical protein